MATETAVKPRRPSDVVPDNSGPKFVVYLGGKTFIETTTETILSQNDNYLAILTPSLRTTMELARNRLINVIVADQTMPQFRENGRDEFEKAIRQLDPNIMVYYVDPNDENSIWMFLGS